VHHWMSSAQFAALYALAQVAPGPNVMYIPLIGWQVAGWAGVAATTLMHIKLSTPRKLLWHYRVATPTIMPASKELPYDDHTTGGPCPA
jgi:Chromate transporter